ncbi:MAG: histidine kinase [Bacteroidota bacterium]
MRLTNKLSFHIWFWLVYTAIFTIVEASYKGIYLDAFMFEIANMPMRFIVIYFNFFYLLPRFLLKGHTRQYIIYTMISLIIGSFILRIMSYYFLSTFYPGQFVDAGIWLPYKFLYAFVHILTPMILLIGMSIVWELHDLQKKTRDLERDKLQAELRFLKSQTNPHFLFNTLNTIYGLALEQSDKVPGLILRLSELLSFTLYESKEIKIPIRKELTLIENLVALQKSRHEHRIQVDWTLPNTIPDYEIAPLLWMPLVENAFKHGLHEETVATKIHIQLSNSNKQLVFQVSNTIPKGQQKETHKKGIGLQNLKRRLIILYKNQHRLDIHKTENQFMAKLSLVLE